MPSHDAVFLDTNGWIALLNADDQFHTQAAKYLRDFEDALTTDRHFTQAGFRCLLLASTS